MDPLEFAILSDLCIPDGMADFFQTEFVDKCEDDTQPAIDPLPAYDWGDNGMLTSEDLQLLLIDPSPAAPGAPVPSPPTTTTTTITNSRQSKKRDRDAPTASRPRMPSPVAATSVLPNSSMETFVDSGGIVTDDMLYELQQRSITLGNLIVQSIHRDHHGGEGGMAMTKRTRLTVP